MPAPRIRCQVIEVPSHDDWSPRRRKEPVANASGAVATVRSIAPGALQSVPPALEYLGTTIDTEEQPSRPQWSCLQLPIDILHVCAGNDDDVESMAGQRLD